ncbi:hypothetical protein QU481_09235 [Crenobacter sp. SG2303]|uniref:Uncharacterized protein n=1 Tax=Crenobacter oryzisoli TaxID=3056844 RepID=A0ABT7XMR5_9NEIS|nr:hypothetical protein [Crenobacter sp. SG2303]MDN0075076.1 hypothetical protein [Crenobacter sp. SG2303]
MSHYYHDHNHTNPHHFHPATAPQSFGAVVGTIETQTEHEIVGRSGEHLQFYVDVHVGVRYQVDVNIRSSDGTPIEVYVGNEDLDPTGSNPDQPFGAPTYGVFPNATLSYAGLGLTDAMFASVSDTRIQSQLESALNQAEFVAVYGMIFDDGGPNGKGIHETHLHPNANKEDGAIVVYSKDTTNKIKRTWFFFKFVGDHI